MIYIILALFALSIAVFLVLKSRNMHIWILPYLSQKISGRIKPRKRHIYFCLADHYEPYFGQADQEEARKLVDDWVDGYKRVANMHSDSEGRVPQHSYFYPVEEYDEYILSELQKLCADGYGDVDIHLHHDNDTADNLRSTLNDFKKLLFEKHNLLRKDDSGNVVYGFIHGNWALDNSRPDGRWCGVDNEIDILLETGCVYDMTMPSAPSDTQTSIINSIYFASEDGKAKSHNHGTYASINNWRNDELLMIQGPLELNWKSRKLGIIPRIEAGELSYDAPPNPDRVQLWEKASICVKGSEEHLFIKLYTHGLQKKNMKMFFDLNGFDNLWSSLENRFKDQDGYELHYVSAWEMYKKIKTIIKNSRT